MLLWCVADPPGRGHLGGVGSGLHAQFEQFAARRDGRAQEGLDSGSVGDAYLSLCPPAGSSRGLHPTPNA